MERCVLNQIKTHLNRNQLYDKFQSAYKEYHSTETLLVRLHDEVLSCLDREEIVFLVLLDLSAALDTLGHRILLHRLEEYACITGSALSWLASYISDRSQSVQVGSVFSKARCLKYGVPQGSVLGPLLFTIYMLPLAKIFNKYGVKYQCFADDTQIYISCKKSNADGIKARLERCAAELSTWMTDNHLKLNASKSECMLIHPRGTSLQALPNISIEENDLLPRPSLRNLGICMDTILSVNSQICMLCKSLAHQIRLISGLKRFLDDPMHLLDS